MNLHIDAEYEVEHSSPLHTPPPSIITPPISVSRQFDWFGMPIPHPSTECDTGYLINVLPHDGIRSAKCRVGERASYWHSAEILARERVRPMESRISKSAAKGDPIEVVSCQAVSGGDFIGPANVVARHCFCMQVVCEILAMCTRSSFFAV